MVGISRDPLPLTILAINVAALTNVHVDFTVAHDLCLQYRNSVTMQSEETSVTE